VALDNEEWPEIVGTVAGDDTILVIASDTPTAAKVCNRLLALLGE
jgi:transcriptional regulator of arginine metabolism